MLNVLFVETPTFTRQILTLLSDDEYTKLQEELASTPDCGDLVRGGGGIRKLRWAAQGRGKSGGIRIIYYWMRDDDRILLLLAYPKSRKDTLTAGETAMLRRLVKEL